jgi:hypothetical protein
MRDGKEVEDNEEQQAAAAQESVEHLRTLVGQWGSPFLAL